MMISSEEQAWIGQIPVHWHLLRFKYLARPSEERNGDHPRGQMLSVSGYRGIEIKQYEDDSKRRSTEDLADYRVVRKGQLVVNTMWLNYAGIGVSDYDGYVSPAYRSYNISDSIHKRYLHHLMRSSAYVAGYTRLLQGIRPNSLQVSTENFTSMPIIVPPYEEQENIANFLDRETAESDELTAKYLRLVQLLKEKRAALIADGVTNSFDATAEMKDSGCAWIGRIPKHWKISRLKYVSPRIAVGIVVNPSDYVATEGLPYIYGGDISEGRIELENCRRISAFDSNKHSKTRLRAGDLLTVRVGAPGITAVVPPSADGGNCASVALIRKSPAFNSDWLCFVMNSPLVQYQVKLVQYGAAQEQFNISHAVEFTVPVPPLEEQNEIAKALERRTMAIDELIASTESAIMLLQERRAAIITGAVTGQIDVSVDLAEHKMKATA